MLVITINLFIDRKNILRNCIIASMTPEVLNHCLLSQCCRIDCPLLGSC